MVNLCIGVTYRNMDKSKAAVSPVVDPSMDGKGWNLELCT